MVSLQAGYDIPYSSDSDRPVAASCGSSSNSSSGSPSVPFYLSKRSSHFHLTRPESASDKSNNPDPHKSAQDNMYNMHSSSASSLFNNSTNTTSVHFSEFSGELDPQKHSQSSVGKFNGLNNLNLSREQFTNFPNTNRPRHQNSQSLLNSTAPPFREPGTFFPPNNDSYSNPLTSPSHDPRVSFDFGRAPGLGSGPKNFQDAFTGSVGGMPLHQGAGKPGFSQPPQGHSIFAHSAPFVNGMHSQTPYGPHIPTNVTQPTSAPAGNLSNSANYTSAKDSVNNQEEISTIFVVGFPEDMQVGGTMTIRLIMILIVLYRSASFRICLLSLLASRQPP